MTAHTAAVQAMQDYIEAHLADEITLADLARASAYSPFHAYRLFRLYLGTTPADYIRRLRLSRSALRLRSGGCRVADVAFDMGFGSADGYTRAFYREFGCNPGEYAKHAVPVPLFIPYGVKFREMKTEREAMENLRTVYVTRVEKPARTVVVKRGKKATDYFPYCDEVGCDVWGTLMSMDSISGEPVCLWLPERYKTPGTSTYVQGVEEADPYTGPVPLGFEVIHLPAALYLQFRGEPFREEDYLSAIEAVHMAMERYDPAPDGLVWDDESPRMQLEPRGERGYIELRAVKQGEDA